MSEPDRWSSKGLFEGPQQPITADLMVRFMRKYEERWMQREITSHRVNPANEELRIVATDEPGAGGANHRYEITGFDAASNPSHVTTQSQNECCIVFQNGPIKEAGVNGITNEALLAIVVDRLQCFQRGPFMCDENHMALNALYEAQEYMASRTRARQARGVEGTNEK